MTKFQDALAQVKVDKQKEEESAKGSGSASLPDVAEDAEELKEDKVEEAPAKTEEETGGTSERKEAADNAGAGSRDSESSDGENDK